MNYKALILILLTIVTWSCQSEENPTEEAVETDTEEVVEATEQGQERTTFIVNIDRLRMRETAGEKGKVIKELEKGTVLYDEGR